MREGKQRSMIKARPNPVPPAPASPPAPARQTTMYFYSGPEGYFYTHSIRDGEQILALMNANSDEWTATEGTV